MPPKIRELESALKRAGFTSRGGKGSHRKYKHPNMHGAVVISGRPGDDARPYQEKDVAKALTAAQRRGR